MLNALVSKAPTMLITLEDEHVQLLPSLAGTPSDDPIVRGTVLLSLASPRAVKQIKVVLEGLCDAFGKHNLQSLA